MNLQSALSYLRPQVNRILAIAPDRRTHQDAALLEVVLRASCDEFKATHRHKGHGAFYEVVGEGTIQATDDLDEEPCTIYRGDDGKVWVRPTKEFDDGRFEKL